MKQFLSWNKHKGHLPRLPISVLLGCSVGALLIVSISIIIFFMGSHGKQLIGNQIMSEASQRVARLSDAIEGRLNDVEQLAFAMRAGKAAFGSPETRDAMLQTILSARNTPLSLRLGDRVGIRNDKGTITLSSAPEDPANRPPDGWSVAMADGALTYVLPQTGKNAKDQSIEITIYPAELSNDIHAVSDLTRDRSFLLANQTSLLAHSNWASSATVSSTITPLAAADDLDLRNIWARSPEYQKLPKLDAHLDRGDFQMRVYVLKAITRPNIELLAGFHSPAHIFGAAFNEMTHFIVAALGILAVSVGIGIYMSISLGRPIQQLANTARQMENLSLEHVPDLQKSMMSELDEANNAILSAFRALGAFAKFVPKDVVKQVMDGSAIGANHTEVRNMTIMFTDLAGFTTLATQRSPEETAAMLSDHFDMVTTIVDQEGGTVDKFLGDGVMAFWGAPAQQPDHAERALHAAQKILETFNETADSTMRLRVGIYTGDVLVGISGSKIRMNYTVIGDPVNIAARLQELGKDVASEARCVALAGGSTVDAADHKADWTVVGSKTLRGRDEPIDVYRFLEGPSH